MKLKQSDRYILLHILQAMFAEFPWSAIILGPEGNYIGGAVLVGPYSVLTAAHKVASYV